VREDRVDHLAEVLVEQLDDAPRPGGPSERREAADVGEHHRADLATAAEAEVVVGPLEHVVHHVPGDEPREDPAQALCSRSCSRFFVRPARR